MKIDVQHKMTNKAAAKKKASTSLIGASDKEGKGAAASFKFVRFIAVG
jgi:hypothetical protein